LSANESPEAIKILQENQENISWVAFSRNPGIFERDYIEMSKKRTMIILEDFLKNVLHPRRIIKFLEQGGDMDDYLIN
jgi:hypothetical protein